MTQVEVNSEYEKIQKIASCLGYTDFTDLQKKAFQNEDAYTEDKNLFIIGPTSSGKTLIPLLLFYRSCLNADAQGTKRPRMLFPVPYRALAEQKQREFIAFFKDLKLNVALSTAEYRDNDDKIREGNVDVAVIINEKVYKFATQNDDFLSRYDYLAFDEVGLIGDSERGIKLDFLILWICARNPGLRLILLGAPNYDWNAYCDSFNFTKIDSDSRDIELKECLFKYDDPQDVSSGDDWEWLLDHDNVNRGHDRDHALCKICSYHLPKGHQILIFTSTRDDARCLCKKLYKALTRSGALHLDPTNLNDYKTKMLDDCKLEEEELFGLMEDINAKKGELDIYYKAFSCGIAFHSAAVPHGLRAYVERGLLEDGTIRIVCSTETLAFGVNSNVDVVVVADLTKHNVKHGIKGSIRGLSANEFNNYIGRAGRLSRTRNTQCGYAYALFTSNSGHFWDDIDIKRHNPLPIHSLLFDREGRLFDEGNSFLPFFILNLIPNGGFCSGDELLKNVGRIPRPQSQAEDAENDLEENVKRALEFLKKNSLITNPVANVPSQYDNTLFYKLTSLGVCMRGYVIGEKDFENIFEAMKNNNEKLLKPIDEVSILYMCVHTKSAESNFQTLGVNESSLSDEDIYNELCLIQQERDCEIPGLEDFGEKLNETRRIISEEEKLARYQYRILAMLLAWMRSETPKKIFARYGIHNALIAQFSEAMCYLIEIVESIMPYMFDLLRESSSEIRNGHDLSELQRLRKNEIRKLYASLFYGLDVALWQRFVEFLKGKGDKGDKKAEELRQDYSRTSLDPITARQLKRLLIRYRFFQETKSNESNESKDRIHQKKQYIKDIRELGEPYLSFFREYFGEQWDYVPDLDKIGVAE